MLKSIVFTYSCLCPSSHLFAYMNSAFLLALLVDIASCVSPGKQMTLLSFLQCYSFSLVRLSVTLVDHNRLATHQQFLAASVREVIDHHVVEHSFESAACTIKPIGSCASLITSTILETQASEIDMKALDPRVFELLLSAVLIDTVNLDHSKGRTFAEDEHAARLLEPLVSSQRDELFSAVQGAKFDCTHLTTTQLLRKDYKEIRAGHVTIGFPAIPLSLEDLVCRVCFERGSQFCFSSALVTWTQFHSNS
eukprot:m.67347 g.67347  ORF g.67347 m.67347 type:complete len:251 (+) comp13631_c0_seq1:411-1163(+)